MVRRADRRIFLRNDRERNYLVECVAMLARERRLAVYAWALMPNHFHLLVGTASAPIEDSIHCLLERFSYVLSRRRGEARDPVPDRYFSIACRDRRHFIEIVRYIHLNPLRGGVVHHLDDLDDYRYTGHSALLSIVPRDWQSTEEVLARFGRNLGWARAAYRKFVADGVLAGANRAGKRSRATVTTSRP
jgi:REP element-mobilizing transposase RayT